MTRDEMFHKVTLRYEELVCKYADKNVTDEQFFNELCCSVYAGEEFEKSKDIILDEHFCFMYRGFRFDVTSCNTLVSKAQLKDDDFRIDFSDRYVTWLYGNRDEEGHTLDEYLELNHDETEDNNCWTPRIYLVPGAWAWGATFDYLPGQSVDPFILKAIDKFIDEKGIDNL